MPSPSEPTPDAFSFSVWRYVAATRPAFLTVTVVAVVLGCSGAAWSGVAFDRLNALLTLVFALLAHAGANVVNDYYDALQGSDEINTDRLFPLTGGSRFIQNGVLSRRETACLGWGLLALVVPAGLWLTAESAPGLILIGLAGLMLAWAYSAPPLQLMARGWGELAIVLAWLLVVLGADFVQRGQFGELPVWLGLPQALLVANILILNQFPDYRADRQVGKANWVVRLGPLRARVLYPLVAAVAAWVVCAGIHLQVLPTRAGWALLPLLASAWAARQLWRFAEQPARLRPAIVATIVAAHGYGVCLALVLWLTPA